MLLVPPGLPELPLLEEEHRGLGKRSLVVEVLVAEVEVDHLAAAVGDELAVGLLVEDRALPS